MANCTPEFWTLKDIKESLEKEWNGKKKILIPMFQRGKRWDKNKKETFIDSLRKRYPIGTLLFYKTVEGTQEIYTLIDGLQRGTCIREYLSSPSKYFKINDIRQESLNKIHNLIDSNKKTQFQDDKINALICNYVHSLKTYEDFEIFELYNMLLSEFPSLGSKSYEFGSAIKEDIRILKDNYNSLSVMTMPAIVYTGEESTLPEIFERINSKGVALTEYEIYAASWPRKEFKIHNESIIEYILKKYDTLNDSEYSIKDYDRNLKRINKNVNSFEYVFGLSKLLQNKYSSLGFYKNLKDDETNPVAFQLLNACFNSQHSQIKDVYKIISRFEEKLDVLENALFDSIEFVNKCIEPILKFKGNNRKDDGKIFHSQYQIMSYISFAFRKKYDTSDGNLKVLDTWKESKIKLISNIWKYYVYDIITKYWGEGGTGKIHSANTENRYFKDLTFLQFSTAYDTYSESLIDRHENKQVLKPSNIDYVILNTIYVNSFSAMDQLSIDKFDVEHIATKEQMKFLNKVTNGYGLPISHIANLCYLPEYENRSKGSKNFYQDASYLKKSMYTIHEVEEKFSFTSRADLEFMDLPYSESDFDTLQLYYLQFLNNRNNLIKKKFLFSLGFDENENNKAETSTQNSNDRFDDKFFRVTRIGELVSTIINYLAENNKLDNNDIFSLMDREFSSTLGCWLPVLAREEENTKDNSGRSRYYSKKIKINGTEYFLCKEWREESRTKFVPWAKNILMR